MLRQSHKEIQNAADGDQRNRDEDDGPYPPPLSPEDSKGPARIPDVDEVEETGDHLYFLIEAQPLLDKRFGPLIQKENTANNDQKDPVFSLHSYAIAAIANRFSV